MTACNNSKMEAGYAAVAHLKPKTREGITANHSKAPEKYRSKLALAGEETVYAKDGTKSIKKGQDPDKVKSAYKEGGWNDLVVIAKGPTFIQKINGMVFSQLTDHDEKYSTSNGWIAFQDHGKGTKVEFKNIRIRIDKQPNLLFELEYLNHDSVIGFIR